MTDASLNRRRVRVALIFVTVALAAVCSILLTYWGGLQVTAANNEVIGCQRDLAAAKEILITLLDAETGARGFMLQGSEEYLEPYRVGLARFEERLHALRRPRAKDVLAPAAVAEIETLSREKFRLMEAAIAARREGGLEASLDANPQGSGKATMDQIRARLGEIDRIAEERLAQAAASRDWATAFRTEVAAAMTLVTLAFVVWAFRRIRADAGVRERLLREVEDQRQLLAVTLTSIGDAVIVTDREGRITFANPEAERLTGWAEQEARGQALEVVFRIVNEQSRQTVESPVQKVLRTGAVVGLANHTLLIRKDGSELPIDDSGAPIRSPDGSVHGVVLVFRDFTEHKAAEQALLDARRSAEQAKRLAEQANSAKDRFLAILSHELRTPLTPILGTASLLVRRPGLDPIEREQLETIYRNAELEARLIDDLLDLTRIARGKIELDLRAVDVATVLRRAIEVCRADLEQRKLKLLVDVGQNPLTVNGDSIRLQQVFWNLLKNAIKFTPEGGEVRVACRPDGKDAVQIEVADSGVGIEADALGRIFDAFEQAEQSVTRQFGGLGLGLAICRTFVALHHGSIRAHSDGPGRGATFQVRLPLEHGLVVPSGDSKDRSGETVRAAQVPVRLLLVEDHADTATVIRLLLQDQGHHVQSAGSIAAALTAFERGEFDLLITDLGLPDGSGVDLFRQLRQRGVRVPAIALSGYGQQQDMEQTRAAGFAAHVVKPVDMQRLERAITETLKRAKGSGTTASRELTGAQPQ